MQDAGTCGPKMLSPHARDDLSQLHTSFPSGPLIIRVPFFLLFGFNKGTRKKKGQKGTTGEPRAFRDLGLHKALGCLRFRLQEGLSVVSPIADCTDHFVSRVMSTLIAVISRYNYGDIFEPTNFN